MKRLLIFSVFIVGFIHASAQWNEGNPTWTNSNVGIGTDNPYQKLSVYGGNFYISNGQESTIYSSAHNLLFSGIPKGYVHRVYTFRPGWGSQGATHSAIQLQTADTNGEHLSTILLHSAGNSFFNGGNLGIGTKTPEQTLTLKAQGVGLGIYDTNPSSKANNRIARYANSLVIQNDFTGSWNDNVVFTDEGKVGIGTISPYQKLSVSGGNFYISNGQESTIYSSQHNLYFSGVPKGYAHRVYTFRPGWGSQGATHSAIQLQTADTNGEHLSTILLHSAGHSFINGGNLGIGTNSPSYKLDVCGTIRAKEIKVDLNGGCDFVFYPDYKLMDLNELENFVTTNKHLPEIASEKEMIENGVNMKEFQMQLLQKVEELTLYTIEQNKTNKTQAQQIEELKQLILLQNEKIKEMETKLK